MPLVITKEKICKYIGESRNDFHMLLSEKKLPAYRTKNHGTWKARKTDLNRWIDKIAEEQLSQQESQP